MNCLERNFELRKKFLKSEIHRDRIFIIKRFIGNKKDKTVDVGCGGFMPKTLGILFACDVAKEGRKLLKSIDWKGKFKKASVVLLPYKDKEFKIAICSEVIEHLDSKEDVMKAFLELDRISEEWIITTPSAYDKDPDHKFHFGYNDDNLFDFIPEEI